MMTLQPLLVFFIPPYCYIHQHLAADGTYPYTLLKKRKYIIIIRSHNRASITSF